MSKLNYTRRMERLADLLEREYGRDRESNTDSLGMAIEHYYYRHAVNLWHGSGAASSQFDALFAHLPKCFELDQRCEAIDMRNSIEHVTCGDCNAVVWGQRSLGPADHNHWGEYADTIQCDNCLAQIPIPPKPSKP